MRFNDFIYFGEGIGNFSKLIKKLNKGKPVTGKYLVALSASGNSLEIYPSLQFVQPTLRSMDIDVVAIFGSEEECFEYIRALSDIAMKRLGEPDLIKALPFYEEEVM